MVETRTRERARGLAESRTTPLSEALTKELGCIAQDLITRGLFTSTMLVSRSKVAAEASLAKRADVIASTIQEVCERHDVRQTTGLVDELTAIFDEVFNGQVETVEREFSNAIPDAVTKLCPDTKLHVDVRRFVESLALFAEGLPMSEEVTQGAVATDGSVRRPIVFICHMKQDSDEAESLFDRLTKAGAGPWLDKRCLVLGDEWEKEIGTAVDTADVFVVCLRPEFDEIGFRQREVRWAIEALQRRPPGQGFIVPFIVEPCELPNWCKPFHAGGDLSKRTSFEDLVRGIEKHYGQKLIPREQTGPSQGSGPRRQHLATVGKASAGSSSCGDDGLSELAVTLLRQAVDSQGRLLVSEHLGGVSYGSIDLKGRDHREMVRHDAALKELTDRSMFERRALPSAKTRREALYEVTVDGYALHDQLGPTSTRT